MSLWILVIEFINLVENLCYEIFIRVYNTIYEF